MEQAWWIFFWTMLTFAVIRIVTLRAFISVDGEELTKRNGDNGLSWFAAAIAAFFVFIASSDIILNMHWGPL